MFRVAKFYYVVLSLLLPPLCATAQDYHGLLNKRERELFDKAMSLYDTRRYHEASRALLKITGRNSQAPDPYFYLGMIGVKQRNNAAIRRYFTKLGMICPNYPEPLAHYWTAVIYYTDSNYSGAVEELNQYFSLVNSPSEHATYRSGTANTTICETGGQQQVDDGVVTKDKARKEKLGREALALYEDASNYLYWSQFLADAYAHPVSFAPSRLSGVSTSQAETLPYVTWDGKSCYFLRMVPEHRRDNFYQSSSEEATPYLMVSLWDDTAFGKARALQAPFNQHKDEGSITITADGNTLYYSIVNKERGYNNCDIYYSRKVNGYWQDLQNAGSNVNGPDSWESQPSITADGQWLYFASNRNGGYGGTDIWRCHRLPNGDWSRAENMGERVNTTGDERHPFIHADNHTLYFASNGWQGFGGYDEYFIDLRNAAQVRPVNIGLPVNSEEDMLCFSVSAGGRTAYYSDNKDVYFFPLHEAARPSPMVFVTVLRPGMPDTAYMLSLTDTNYIISYREGYFPFLAVVTGYAAASQQITISPEPLVLNRKYPLPSANYHIVDAIATWLLQHPRIHIRIEGRLSRIAEARLLQQGCRAERIVAGNDTGSLVITVTQQ